MEKKNQFWESKYYAPDVEEFHVGFEYEREEPYLGVWDECEVEEYFSFKHFNKYSEEFRVKYLDKEDIESLGFKLVKEYKYFLEFTKQLDDGCVLNIMVHRDFIYKDIYIYETYIRSEDYEENKFEGNIRNKSELIRVLKQINQ